jgi:hypothetical protein
VYSKHLTRLSCFEGASLHALKWVHCVQGSVLALVVALSYLLHELVLLFAGMPPALSCRDRARSGTSGGSSSSSSSSSSSGTAGPPPASSTPATISTASGLAGPDTPAAELEPPPWQVCGAAAGVVTVHSSTTDLGYC